MSDAHVHDRLSAWLDGALPPAEAERVARHVAGCAECAAARDALVEQDQALKAALTHDPGDAYLESLSRRVEAAVGPAPRPRKAGAFATPLLLRWASVAAVLVVGSVVAYLVRPPGPMLSSEKRSELQKRRLSASAPEGHGLAETEPAPKVEVPERVGAAAEPGATPPSPNAALRAPGAADQIIVRDLKAAKSKDEGLPSGVRLLDQEAAGPRDQSAPAPAPAGSSPVEGSQKRRDAESRPRRESDSTARQLLYMKEPAVAQNEQTGEVQVCGRVTDPKGAPVAGAQVVATNLGRVATADAEGRYCLTLPPGRHDLRALAVGHVSVTRPVIIGAAGAKDVALTMAPVSALGEGLVMGDKSQPGFTSSPERLREAGAAPSLSPEQKAAQNAMEQARSAQARAASRKTASAWDAAAAEWEKALRLVEGGDSELEARAAIAECRYRAWKAEPTASRSRRATEALTAYLVRAPVGPARDRAAAWAEELK